jgi:hypothetical protein
MKINPIAGSHAAALIKSDRIDSSPFAPTEESVKEYLRYNSRAALNRFFLGMDEDKPSYLISNDFYSININALELVIAEAKEKGDTEIAAKASSLLNRATHRASGIMVVDLDGRPDNSYLISLL